MSSSELAELESLLERVLPDPRGYAERVVQQMAARFAVDDTDGTQNTAAYEAVVDRNVLLSAALGACECWGQDPGCPNCTGEGVAGWLDPDPALFAEYIEPAVARMTGTATSAGKDLIVPSTAGEPE